MASQITGQQLLEFFQDPSFWGNGQSFLNLRMVIDGNLVGEDAFRHGFDPSDISPHSVIDIMGGVWIGRGFSLPDHTMSSVFESWRAGQKPMKTEKNPVEIDLPSPALSEKENKPAASLVRPSFMSKSSTSLTSNAAVNKRPVFSN